MSTNNDKQKTKQIICRMNNELFLELDYLREQLGVNWSFQVRQFLQYKVEQLKKSKLEQIKY
jgi:hypothetical protein